MKKVLVIGNGYDLAHGLKTSYSDFLNFVRDFKPVENNKLKKINNEFSELIKINPFIRYLLHYTTETLDTWVDLENELKRVTYAVSDFFMNPQVDDRHYEFNENSVSDFTLNVLEQFGFIPKFGSRTRNNKRPIEPMYFDPIYMVHWDKIKVKLRKDLDDLKRALVIYLKYYMPLISNKKRDCIKQLSDINPDYVITFNYTDTYIKYGIVNEESKILHVHGDLKTEKIVLGYDDDDQEDLTLITYKKYFQRIQYQLSGINKVAFSSKSVHGEKYKKYPDSEVHIYGMSLDKTDEDIIKQIYEMAGKVVIYYLVKNDANMEDYERKVVNLIAILGKREFLNAIETKKITFREIDSTKVKKVKVVH